MYEETDSFKDDSSSKPSSSQNLHNNKLSANSGDCNSIHQNSIAEKESIPYIQTKISTTKVSSKNDAKTRKKQHSVEWAFDSLFSSFFVT